MPDRALVLTVAGAGLIGLTAMIDPAPRLIWNTSASAPVGLYRIHPSAPPQTGDFVLARLPEDVRQLAAERRYLPFNVPLVKRVAAVSGDTVCAVGAAVSINGRVVARRRERDRAVRPLPWWHGCRVLDGEAFLLMADMPDSFDGRYLGPVPVTSIIGRAVALWTE